MAKAKEHGPKEVPKRGGTGEELIADPKFAIFITNSAARHAGENAEAVKRLSNEDVEEIAKHVLTQKELAPRSENPNEEQQAGADFSSFLTESYASVQSFVLNLPPDVKTRIVEAVLEFAGLV